MNEMYKMTKSGVKNFGQNNKNENMKNIWTLSTLRLKEQGGLFTD